MRLCISVDGAQGETELISGPWECGKGFPEDVSSPVGMCNGQG